MCQQQYDRICRLGISHRKSYRNSEYFPGQPQIFERFRKEKTVEAKVAKSAGNGNAMGMMDTIATFQNGAWYARHAGYYCDVSKWRRFGTDTPTTSFLDFSRKDRFSCAAGFGLYRETHECLFFSRRLATLGLPRMPEVFNFSSFLIVCGDAATKTVRTGHFILGFSRKDPLIQPVYSQFGTESTSSRPELCPSKPELFRQKVFVKSPEILSYVTRNFIMLNNILTSYYLTISSCVNGVRLDIEHLESLKSTQEAKKLRRGQP